MCCRRLIDPLSAGRTRSLMWHAGDGDARSAVDPGLALLRSAGFCSGTTLRTGTTLGGNCCRSTLATASVVTIASFDWRILGDCGTLLTTSEGRGGNLRLNRQFELCYIRKGALQLRCELPGNRQRCNRLLDDLSRIIIGNRCNGWRGTKPRNETPRRAAGRCCPTELP